MNVASLVRECAAFWLILFLSVGPLCADAAAQTDFSHHVLAFRPTDISDEIRPLARGAGAVWQKLTKLRTTASVLHTTAHPDDEHVGLLTRLSRGDGVRTTLLSLSRGEGGANAIGDELFDALGVVRAEELRLAGSIYGLDDLYFTNAVDYGYSKTLDEAMRSWNVEAILEDMVRIIRINRPIVVVSRWHGSDRDGHGHHQLAGVLTPAAVAAAADPARFPDQLRREGLRPWRVKRLYRGGVRSDEMAHARYDASVYDARIGATYEELGRYGVSLQRSQTAGRIRRGGGPASYRYERVDSAAAINATTFFDGVDVSLTGLPELVDEPVSAVVERRLEATQEVIGSVIAEFDWERPARSIPRLVHAFRRVNETLSLLGQDSDIAFALRVKQKQLVDAIVHAGAFHVTARLVAVPPSHAVVSGDTVQVAVHVQNPNAYSLSVDSVRFAGTGVDTRATTMTSHEGGVYSVHVRADAVTQSHVRRSSISLNHYDDVDSLSLYLPSPTPAIYADVWLSLDGTPIRLREAVRGQVSDLPKGYVHPEVIVVPPISVAVEPRLIVARKSADTSGFSFNALLVNGDRPTRGTVGLKGPPDVTVSPDAYRFDMRASGETQTFRFHVNANGATGPKIAIEAAAVIGADTLRTSVQHIRHSRIEWRSFRYPAQSVVRRMDVVVPESLIVGYVMGVGDEVPAAIERLGASVRLLTRNDLAGTDLGVFDTIVIGTRAYAVRADLVEYNERLIQYATRGGNLVVLYQTPEYVPGQMAPYPADLPNDAEEVSEEDAVVRLLVPGHSLLRAPNQITRADFAGWIEQRGSKFFSTWSEEYTALVELNDTGQSPQRGAWLTARVGRGHFTYVALALHRQLPYGVEGAYRILANLISLH